MCLEETKQGRMCLKLCIRLIKVVHTVVVMEQMYILSNISIQISNMLALSL